jgi:hypothetical protein
MYTAYPMPKKSFVRSVFGAIEVFGELSELLFKDSGEVEAF